MSLALALALALLNAGAAVLLGAGGVPDDLPPRLELATDRAIQFLLSQQSTDGAWRSSTYGTLQDGITLTPVVMKVLAYAPETESLIEARERGAAFLRSWLDRPGARGASGAVLDFPVYTSALAALALSRVPGGENERAAQRWIDVLVQYQISEALGWEPDDLAYGGFGYSVQPPRKPPASRRDDLPFDADLSSTLFALGALRSGGSRYALEIERALRFVERCQNFADAGHADARFDDGGFFLTPTNAVQNKAGAAGTDDGGRVRYHSYGSATADGLRALACCGLGPDHPRVVAARRWLERNFSVTTNPGRFVSEREPERDAAYFYWCWSVAHALRQLGVLVLEQGGERLGWPTALADELLRRQHPDGSWRNSYGLLKEDDPLVATALAVGTLQNCRLAGAQ